jgi:FMN-dependent NADH-azoreductase
MNTLLIVHSSPRSNSVSRRLSRHVAEQWRAHNPDGRVIERDLVAEPLPFLTESWIQASVTPAAQRTPEQNHVLALSDTLIEELLAADVIVLGVPMHNFSIPASLKAWIDLVTRAGKTFSYGDKGPKGLMPEGKQVLAIVSRGGSYGEGTPSFAADFQVPYLRHMLGFIGLKSVTVIEADKQAFGPDVAQQSVEDAVRKLSALAGDCQAQLAASA